MKPIPREAFERFRPQSSVRERASGTGVAFDIEGYLSKCGFQVLRRKPWGSHPGGEIFELVQCPFDISHTQGSAALTIAEGKPGFECKHNGCHGKMIKDVFRLYPPEPGRGTPEAMPQAQPEMHIVLVGADEFLSRKSGDDKPFLVKGLLPAQSQTIWQGRPKVGKSHTLLQIAFDMACGLPVFGHFAVPRALRCVYVELEEPESITKDRFAKMLRAHAGQGPDACNLRFFTRNDLAKYKMRSQEILGARLRDFAAALRDGGAEMVFLIAARKLVDGNLKDPEVAERLNDGLDLLTQETGATNALGHHSRKEVAETLEAQGLGHTFLAAHADASFDISRAADGIRKVGREGRYDEDTFYLRKVSEGDGELIRVSDPPADPQDVAREELLKRVSAGESVYKASKSLGVAYPTAKRWASEARQAN